MTFFYKHKPAIFAIFLIAVLFTISVIAVITLNPYPLKYKTDILFVAEKYNIAPEIIASVVNAESGFKEDAKSRQGALGLMQIMPSTAEWVCSLQNKPFDKNLLLEKEYNLDVGSYYLKYLLDKFTSLETALAAYNAGEGNVMLWLLSEQYSPDQKNIITTPFKETNFYIEKVLTGVKIYKNKLK